jgi:hypothetical protein
VVAAGEYIGPWCRLQSFLAVEELAAMLPLSQAIPLAADRLDAVTFRRWKRGLATEVARLARLLHDRRCFHKDLYLCHFYIAEEDTRSLPDPAQAWRGRVYLIDLHRLSHHGWTWWLWQTKDLAQLLYSSVTRGRAGGEGAGCVAVYCSSGSATACTTPVIEATNAEKIDLDTR